MLEGVGVFDDDGEVFKGDPHDCAYAVACAVVGFEGEFCEGGCVKEDVVKFCS